MFTSRHAQRKKRLSSFCKFFFVNISLHRLAKYNHNLTQETRAAVGMGIPMGIPMGMGMGWVWEL